MTSLPREVKTAWPNGTTLLFTKHNASDLVFYRMGNRMEK